jgi:hypothetical protein
MIDLLLDYTTKDMQLINLDFALSPNIVDYVGQKLRILLSTVLGEWYLDITAGLPYFEEILVKNPNMSYVDSLVKAAILSVPEVSAIVQYTSLYETNRELQIDFTVETTTGSTVSVTI